MIQVDVYPNQECVPQQTLHLCLATSSEGRGVLLTIGRKAALALADKAVSREHALLTVKTTNPQYVSDGRGPVLATRQDEVEACRASHDECCLVFTNLGKLGSYVVQELSPTTPPSESVEPLPKDSDDDETDEDEPMPSSMPQSQSAAPPLSNATKALVKDPAAVTLRSLDRGEDYVMNQLSLWKPSAAAAPDQPQHSRVIIQLGKGGSTIVLTRRPILFVVGSADKADYHFMSRLLHMDAHYISASDEDAYYHQITHHVTPQRSVSPKQVTSWLLRRKMVHPDYFETLLQRSSPWSPLPAELEPQDDGNEFWRTTPSPALYQGWKLWTLVSYDPRDAGMEAMIRATGASVMRVYELGRTVAEQVKAMRERLAANSPSKARWFMLDTKSKKKVFGDLQKTLGIQAIPTKSIAKHLTTHPKQPDGTDLELATTREDERAESAPRTLPAKDTDNAESSHPRIGHSRNGKADNASSSQTLAITERLSWKTNASLSELSTTANHSTMERTLEAGSDDVSSRNVAHREESPLDHSPSPQHPSSVTPKESSARPAPTDSPKDDYPAGEQQYTAQGAPYSTMDHSNKEKDDAYPSAGDWLAAAPKGKRRRIHVRDKADIGAALGVDAEDLLDAAPTRCVPGLVLQAQGQTIHPALVSSGSDFKAFRKNLVPSPPRARIQLRVHKSKVSEAELRAAAHLEELEEQRRRADALFAGAARIGGVGRRRR